MKLIFYTLALLSIISINAQQKETPIIDIDKGNSHKGNLTMSDIFSDVRYIKLDFNEKYPIKIINEITITPECILLNVMSNGQSILKYTREGKFICMIGSRGKGPGEYLDGSTMIVDEKNKRIYVRANYTERIHVYDYVKNKYLYSIPVKNEDRKFYLLTNEWLWCDGPYILRYTPSYYSWKVIDTKGRVLKKQKSDLFTISKADKQPNGIIFPNTNCWESFGSNTMSLWEIGTNIIYSLKKDLGVVPRFVIKWSALKNKELANLYFNCETPRYLILRTSYNEIISDGYYDKEKKEYYTYEIDNKTLGGYNVGIKNDLDGGLPFLSFRDGGFMQHSNTWVCAIDAYQFTDYINSSEFKYAKAISPNKKEKFRHFVRTLSEDDNPVLMVATLKE